MEEDYNQILLTLISTFPKLSISLKSKFKHAKASILWSINTDKLLTKLGCTSYFQPACLYLEIGGRTQLLVFQLLLLYLKSKNKNSSIALYNTVNDKIKAFRFQIFSSTDCFNACLNNYASRWILKKATYNSDQLFKRLENQIWLRLFIVVEANNAGFCSTLHAFLTMHA